MKRIVLGLTPQERDQRDAERRTQNCLIALAVLVSIAGLVLFWLDTQK